MSWNAALNQMDAAIMSALNDGVCDYQGTGFAVQQIGYLLERDIELFDSGVSSHGVSQFVTAITLSSVALGAKSRQGDLIVTQSRTWTVQQTLSDDGSMRQLCVT